MVRHHGEAAAGQAWAAQQSRLLLYLEQEEPQVDVLGGQQLVALHGVDDGQRHVVRLVALVGEDKVVDDRADLHIVIGTLEQQEGRLTWLVYIIGAVIGGRVSFASTDEQDAMDGELVCRVLQLMNLTDSRLAQAGNEKLELAMLSFFEQFRKIYIGDQVQKSSKLYRRLSEVLGLNDETMVLSVFIGKIITNLKYWGRCEPITSKTLQLLNDLSIGYSSVRKLVKLSAVQFMLNNHTSEHFSFLGINNQSNLTDMRCRTTFYTALGRLLMVDLGEDEDQYEQFMLPLTAAFEAVAQMFSTNSFNEQEAKVSPSPTGQLLLSGNPTETRLASAAENSARPYISH